jgi:Uma2 family endonuclease
VFVLEVRILESSLMATRYSKKTKRKSTVTNQPKLKSKPAKRASVAIAKNGTSNLSPVNISGSESKAVKKKSTAAPGRKSPKLQTGPMQARRTRKEAGAQSPASKLGTSQKGNGRPAAQHGCGVTNARESSEIATPSARLEDRPVASPVEDQSRETTSKPPGDDEILAKLFEALASFAGTHHLGQVVCEGRFDWGGVQNQGLRPDLAFVSFHRWAEYRRVPRSTTWHIVPDLVVEIVRGSEEAEQVGSYLEDYFRAGVNRVWVVYPGQLKVHDYVSLSSARVLDRQQSIDGGSVLPGFQLPLSELSRSS